MKHLPPHPPEPRVIALAASKEQVAPASLFALLGALAMWAALAGFLSY